MIELEEALRIVLGAARPLGVERVELHEALGRILAEDVAADMDLPPFDKATVDGYACRRADLANALTVIETIPAGGVPARVVGPNQCAKIMTGAVVPPGADCVIMIEQTEPVAPDAVAGAGLDRGAGVSPLRVAGVPPAVRGQDALDTKEQGQDALATEEQGQDALATEEQGQDALATEEQGQDALATEEQGQDALATEEQGQDALATGDQGRDALATAAIRFVGRQTPDNIFRRGMDLRQGQVVLSQGSRIGPPHVAVLASVGCVQPLVARRPRVGVIAGGDELVAPGAKPGPAQIRNTNIPQLVAQLAGLGLKARDYGIVKDVAADIDRVLKTALAENDVVLVSGGVSVGDFDLAPAAMQRNGVRLLFEKVAVKPGKPTVFGILERVSRPRREGEAPATQAYCLGLPGNPVATFAVFELLVKPFLYKLMGHTYTPVCVQMRLDEAVARKDTDRQSWIPVRSTSRESVKPVPYHGSPHLSALGEADGLVPMEIGVAHLGQGTPVPVRLL